MKYPKGVSSFPDNFLQIKLFLFKRKLQTLTFVSQLKDGAKIF